MLTMVMAPGPLGTPQDQACFIFFQFTTQDSLGPAFNYAVFPLLRVSFKGAALWDSGSRITASLEPHGVQHWRRIPLQIPAVSSSRWDLPD